MTRICLNFELTVSHSPRTQSVCSFSFSFQENALISLNMSSVSLGEEGYTSRILIILR